MAGIVLETPDHLGYHFIPEPSKSFSFQIKASNDAHIALLSGPNEINILYEVFIGGWNNTRSVIRKDRSKPDVVVVSTPNILDRSQFRSFRIIWMNNNISVYKENSQVPFLIYETNNLHLINYIGVTTGWGAKGSWNLQYNKRINSLGPLTFNTGEKALASYLENRCGFVEFQLKAARDTTIFLCNQNNKAEYEVHLGIWNNSKCSIRKASLNGEMAEVLIQAVINCFNYTSFYVSWINGNILVGKRGESPFLYWSDPSNPYMQIHKVGFSSGVNNPAAWIVSVPFSGGFRPPPIQHLITMSTPDKLEYNFIPNNRGILKFKIQAAHDCHIALTSMPMESNPMYEVFIGGWKNSKSVIRKNRTKPDRAEVITPGILSPNDFRGFWVKWQNGTISAGRENDTIPFLIWTDQERVSINYVGICTGWGATGNWRIEQN